MEDQYSEERVPCSICGRSFAPEVLTKHSGVCRKSATAAAKRKPFDSSKQRVIEGELSLKQIKDAQKKEIKPPKSHWREKHQDFINAVRNARGLQDAISSGGPLPPPPPPSVNPDYVQCPHCSRRFNQQAADRHINFCKDKQSLSAKNKPSSNVAAKQNTRVNYQPPKPKVKASSAPTSAPTPATKGPVQTSVVSSMKGTSFSTARMPNIGTNSSTKNITGGSSSTSRLTAGEKASATKGPGEKASVRGVTVGTNSTARKTSAEQASSVKIPTGKSVLSTKLPTGGQIASTKLSTGGQVSSTKLPTGGQVSSTKVSNGGPVLTEVSNGGPVSTKSSPEKSASITQNSAEEPSNSAKIPANSSAPSRIPTGGPARASRIPGAVPSTKIPVGGAASSTKIPIVGAAKGRTAPTFGLKRP